MKLTMLLSVIETIRGLEGRPVKSTDKFMLFKSVSQDEWQYQPTKFGVELIKYIRDMLSQRCAEDDVKDYIQICQDAEKNCSLHTVNLWMRPFITAVYFEYFRVEGRQHLFYLDEKHNFYIKLNTLFSIVYGVGYGRISTENELEFEWMMPETCLDLPDIQNYSTLKGAIDEAFDSTDWKSIFDLKEYVRDTSLFDDDDSEDGDNGKDLSVLKKCMTYQILVDMLEMFCKPVFAVESEYRKSSQYIDLFNSTYEDVFKRPVIHEKGDRNFYRNQHYLHETIAKRLELYSFSSLQLNEIIDTNLEFYCFLYERCDLLCNPHSSRLKNNMDELLTAMQVNKSGYMQYYADEFFSMHSLSYLQYDRKAIKLWIEYCHGMPPLLGLYMSMYIKKYAKLDTGKAKIKDNSPIRQCRDLIYRVYCKLLLSVIASVLYENDADKIRNLIFALSDNSKIDNHYGLDYDLKQIYSTRDANYDSDSAIYGLRLISRTAKKRDEFDSKFLDTLADFQNNTKIEGKKNVLWIDFYNTLSFEAGEIRYFKLYSVISADSKGDMQLLELAAYESYEEIFEKLDNLGIKEVNYLIADKKDGFYKLWTQHYKNTKCLPLLHGSDEGIYDLSDRKIIFELKKLYHSEDLSVYLSCIRNSSLTCFRDINNEENISLLEEIYELPLNLRENLYPIDVLFDIHKKNKPILASCDSSGGIAESIETSKLNTEDILRSAYRVPDSWSSNFGNKD